MPMKVKNYKFINVHPLDSSAMNGRSYMTSNVGGRGGSFRADFILKGALTKHQIGGIKKAKKHLTSYTYGWPLIKACW